MHAQDHLNPFAGNALPPTRGRRSAVGERQKVSWRDVGSVSRSSTVRGQFPGQSSVDDSRLAILAKARCKHIERFTGVTCTMLMNDGNHVSLSGVSAPSGERGELIAVGQMAMAIDHGGRQAMPTGGTGSSIGGWPSGTQKEATMGAWTVHPLYREPPGIGGAREAGKDGAPFSCQTAAESTA